MKKIKEAINTFFKTIYLKLFQIDDTPQKIALGLGLGVALGIIPGTGPVAAIFFAFLFHLNRASAILGSIFTNTWLSFVTFLLAVKTGAWILGLSWKEVYAEILLLFHNFSYKNLLKISFLKIIFPVILGYILVAFCLGFVVYLITILALKKVKRNEDKSRINVSG